MSFADEHGISDDLGDSEPDTTNAAPPASTKSLKNFASKKGPKLSRGRGKNPVTLNNKAVSKPQMKKSGGAK